MSGGVSLRADGVEVGGGGVLAVGERDVLEASALDDGERNGGHFDCSWYSVCLKDRICRESKSQLEIRRRWFI